jgi:hypothetical protein
VICDLVPGGVRKEISAGHATKVLDKITPAGPIETARRDLAAQFPGDLRRLDTQLAETNKKLAAAIRASGTTVTEVFGVGSVNAGTIIGDASDICRFPSRDHFAAYNGTAGRGVLREPEDLPAVAARQPAHEPRHPHGRHYPDPPCPQ